jgi:hypothetical protein
MDCVESIVFHRVAAASEEGFGSKEFVCSVGICLVREVVSFGDLGNGVELLRIRKRRNAS